MNKILTSSILLLGAMALLSCENDDLQVTETDIPAGYALQPHFDGLYEFVVGL